MNAHFDCFSGISGNMTLGALLDLGVPGDWLEATLKAHLLNDFDLMITATSRMGIAAQYVEVAAKSQIERDYAAICRMIESCSLSPKVKSLSLAIFEKLAAAESKIHGCPKDHVHFHELGGVDAIVDIVGTCLCVEYLGLEKITASKIPLGSGFVDCAHGRLPVPAPATLAILKDVPVYGTNIPFELVTPTGAAIIATLAEGFGPMPDMVVSKIGYGSGTRHLETIPNLLRVIAGASPQASDTVTIIETSIDDMNPEIYGYLMERLFAGDALDVNLIPVFMKKNRPGTLLQVLCHQQAREALIRIILTETTTLGVRYYTVERRLLAREAVTLETGYGPVKAKKVKTPDGAFRVVPEYEACREIAQKNNIPIRVVYEKIVQHVENLIK
ncbi:MAG: nickel pincer cofactor biosynthesis protein LarC [Desulfobacteraceae bacterium]|nr:MAG: nickel pincer cofactor biosynthesis protein LarC [Desulfobacteraceae bacterium]